MMRRFLCLLRCLLPMRLLSLCLMLAGLLTAGLLPTVAMAAPPRPVLVLGDSLSAAHNIAMQQGWVHLLQVRLHKMEPPRAVINASISGETSLSGRNRLPALLQQYRPSVLILELGANDGLQGLSLAQLRENLAAMLDAARKANVKVLLLGIELPVNYGPRYRDGLRTLYAELAKKYQAALVPFLLEGVALDPALMQADGMHPTAAGEPRVLENVWAQLQPLLHPAPSPEA